MDPTVRDALLQDPRVCEAIKSAGQNALSNPEVQAEIIEACKQRFPEIAAAARAKVVEWANDPEVQRQAYSYAGLAADYTQYAAQRAVGQVSAFIEQGPAGLRVLAFAGGVASCVNAALFMFGVLNPASAVTQMDVYVLHGYLIAFAVTTMLFEAKPEWIQMVSGLNMYQNLLLDKAQFLSEVLGRGLFYGFQGTLWLSFASFSALQNYLLALWLLILAMFHVCMHFDVMPHEVVAKIRRGASGYQKLPGSEDEAARMPEQATVAQAELGQAGEAAKAGARREEPTQVTSPISQGLRGSKGSLTAQERRESADTTESPGQQRGVPAPDATEQRLLNALKGPRDPPLSDREQPSRETEMEERKAPVNSAFADKKNRGQTKNFGDFHGAEETDGEVEVKKKNCCALQ